MKLLCRNEISNVHCGNLPSTSRLARCSKRTYWSRHGDCSKGAVVVTPSHDKKTNKRRKLSQRSSGNKNDSLSEMPQDCVLSILQFLPAQDLANVAVTSRRLSVMCSHRSLPQLRAATLICKTPFLSSLLLRLRSQKIRGVFDIQSRSTLKLVGCHKLATMKQREVDFYSSGLFLSEVKSLEFCGAASYKERQIKNCVLTALAPLLPNLKELNLNNTRIPKSALSTFIKCRPQLHKISWDGHSNCVDVTGQDFADCQTLTELYMDNAMFYVSDEEREKAIFETSRGGCIFSLCNQKLERVSLQGATFHLSKTKNASPKPFSQEGLMRFVRETKSLQWFRSDLSPENIDVLKKERPEVCFESTFLENAPLWKLKSLN